MSPANKITAERLDELKSRSLLRADASVFGDLPEGTVYEPDGVGETPGQHAHHFLAKTATGCPSCGHSWEWSMLHGSGHCVNCGYPVRAYHYFREPGKEKDTMVATALWYHPEELQVRS